MKLSFTFLKIRVLALLVLAPLFYIIYGWANDFCEGLNPILVSEIVYSWEQNIPFVPCTILPYWSVNLLYGVSLFLPITLYGFRQHFFRLLVATPIAVIFFITFPLTFSSPKPNIDSVWSILFESLSQIDKPYNQAPSLHIILLVIIWQIFLPALNRIEKIFWHFWCFLIGISVLTTFQHHFIDVPTGFLVGVLICYIFPLEQELKWKFSKTKSLKIGLAYISIALIFIFLSLQFDFIIQIIFWWIAFSFVLVGLGYLFLNTLIFQKKLDGRFTFASLVLLFPFRISTKLVRYIFFRTNNSETQIYKNLYIGNYQSSGITKCDTVFDLCAEYKTSNTTKNYNSFPIIDLCPPTIDELNKGVEILDDLSKHNTVLIHCALGLSRSVTFVVAWLLKNNIIETIEEAEILFEQKNYKIHISEKDKDILNALKNPSLTFIS